MRRKECCNEVIFSMLVNNKRVSKKRVLLKL